MSGRNFAGISVSVFASIVMVLGLVEIASAQYQGRRIGVLHYVSRGLLASLRKGTVQVIDLSVNYSEDDHPEENFRLACDIFAIQSKEGKGELYLVRPSPKKNYIFEDPGPPSNWRTDWIRNKIIADCAEAREYPAKEEARRRSAEDAAEARRKEAEARREERELEAIEVARIRDEVADRFRTGVVAAWQAVDEKEPFASIRVEFDLSSPTPAWKTTLLLPYAERCALRRVPTAGPGTGTLWIYGCKFNTNNGLSYQDLVGKVGAALGITYQPDETALNVNQVFFSDPSKPNWRLILTKLDSSSVVLSVKESGAGSVLAFGAVADSTSASIRDEIDTISAGRHAPMPSAQRLPTSPQDQAGKTIMTIRNSTAYELTVLFDGPVSTKAVLLPGAVRDINLAAGAFHVAGRVTASGVLPFYGDEVYANAAHYSVEFYIRR